MTVAVLALQGAFAEHENVLKRLGVDCIELRQAKDLETPYDGIILPGGESTVQGKLLKELGMFDTIKEQIENGMPVTCNLCRADFACLRGGRPGRMSLWNNPDVRPPQCLWQTAWKLPYRR